MYTHGKYQKFCFDLIKQRKSFRSLIFPQINLLNAQNEGNISEINIGECCSKILSLLKYAYTEKMKHILYKIAWKMLSEIS